MKAIVYRTYGSPDVLHLEEMDKPFPGDKELLIKVRAASVNPYDWHFMRGKPYLVRLMAGRGKPKFPGLGADVAGIVEAAGAGVTQFHPGDEVFGTCRGAYAEYVCAPESSMARKPANVSFEQAAAKLPIAACTALQSLRDKGHIRPGASKSWSMAVPEAGSAPSWHTARKILRRTCNRRHQQQKPGPRPSPRRRPGHRLHPRQFHPRRPALRPGPRLRRQPFSLCFEAHPDSWRHSRRSRRNH